MTIYNNIVFFRPFEDLETSDLLDQMGRIVVRKTSVAKDFRVAISRMSVLVRAYKKRREFLIFFYYLF